MIVHGLPMKTPKYTEEQQMKPTMLRRSINDDSVNYNNVANKLGYEYATYGKVSPAYTAKGSERVGG